MQLALLIINFNLDICHVHGPNNLAADNLFEILPLAMNQINPCVREVPKPVQKSEENPV